jgi:shikimate kinase
MKQQHHKSIALIGLSGAGKSSVGRVLAASTGWPLRDTDALIVAATGRSIAEIFAAEGEPRFRELEAHALAEALAGGPAIVATGGGAVLREANRALLRAAARCVWLDAATATLVARLSAHAERRPLLGDAAPAERLEALRGARAPLYAALAHLCVPADAGAPEQIAAHILAALGQGE